MAPKNGAASEPSRLSIRLEDRLSNYAAILKQLDVVLAELEPDGLVAIDVRDRFERLVVAERMRVANLSRTVKMASGNPALPPITKPNGSEKTAKNSGTGSGTQNGAAFSRL